MKNRILLSIPVLALCAFVLGACTQEQEDPTVQNDHFGEATDVEPSPIAFSSQAFDATKTGEELPAVPLCTFKDASDGTQTKTTLSGSTLYWANGDGIAVYEYLSGTLKQSDRCTTTSTSTTGSFTPVTSAKQQNTSWMTATGAATETYDFYSYYPASGSPATPSTGAVSLSNVAATQAGTLAGIGQYLICYGVDSKTRSQIAAGTYPAFAFEPNVAILHVTLTNSTGADLSSFRNFAVTANGDTGIVGAASLNLTTGVLTPSADTKTVTCSASSSTFANAGTKEYYFAVMPSESATTLSFAASATNASSETYSLTMANHSLSGGIFGGYIYNIAVSISAASLTATAVSITSSEATLWKGKTTTYSANITYSGGTSKSATSSDVTWSSSAESVATVNANGVVTAVNYGEANITATSKATGSVYGTKKVYVNAVNSLTFSPTSMNVTVNKTNTFTATVTLNDGSAHYGSPSLVINTSSANTSVATVAATSYAVSSFTSGSGSTTVTVNGVSAGGPINITGTIPTATYTSTSGSDKTASCSVTVVTVIDLTNSVLDGWASSTPLAYYGVANCFVVQPNTNTQTFDVGVFDAGSGYARGTQSSHSTTYTNAAARVAVIWRDNSSLAFSTLSLSSDKNTLSVAKSSGTVYGNALIGLYDDSGNLLWSFHLWCPNSDQLTTMTYALGQTTTYAAPYMFYQWGRKDPLGMAKANTSSTLVDTYYSGTSGSTTATSKPTTTSAGQVTQNVARKNPTTFYTYSGDWCSTQAQYWNATSKTMYDPCPSGYHVPSLTQLGSKSTTGGSTYGYYITTTTSLSLGVGGYRDDSSGAVNFLPSNNSYYNGSYWSSEVSGANASYLDFYSHGNSNTDTDSRANGYAVRCVQD